MASMKVVTALALLLVSVQISRACDGEGNILICWNIPSYFSPGYSTLVMYLSDVGEIDSTVLRSDGLASVTRLRIENAGVTGIAEGAFGSFQKLTTLSLKNNMVTEVNSNWFGRPVALSELILTNNQIEGVNESMLSGLMNLTKLSLKNNTITTIGPNSFSSQTHLAELDLSDNKITKVSPQVFSSLRSTRIRLDGNPWDCTCGAKDSVDALTDLWSRSLLDTQINVTCDSPLHLRGQPVWNVSVCETLPLPRPSGTQTIHPKPTDTLNTVPVSSGTSAKVVTTPLLRPTSKTDTSVQPKATDAPSVLSSHTATSAARPTSETKTSVQPKPTDVVTTGTYVTSSPSLPPSEAQTSVHPKPSDTHRTVSPHTEMTETCVTSEPSSNTVCTLIAVIAVLCVLLFVLCFLAVLHRRKRNNKTVTPGRPKEEKNKAEEDSGSSRAQLPGHSQKSDPEMGWWRPSTEARAKSANAVLLMSSFSVSGKDQVMSQKEPAAQSRDTENQAGGKQQHVNKADGVTQAENLSTSVNIEKDEEQADAGEGPGENLHCVSVNTETAPYLSIGTKPDDPNKESTNSPGQRSLEGKVMGRISTWPPTAVQWQARCKMKEEEQEDRCDGFTDWTQNDMSKFSSEVKKMGDRAEHPSGFDGVQKDENEKNQDLQTEPTINPSVMNEAHMTLRHSESSKPDKTPSLSEAHTNTDMMLEEQIKDEEIIQDLATGTQTESKIQNQNKEEREDQACKTTPNPAHKLKSKSSNKAEQRREAKGAATSRQKQKQTEDRATGSKAPSGGVSPDDETLLSGNEYAFMDLLHEVVQNNGRWTRERWKQIHISQQRR